MNWTEIVLVDRPNRGFAAHPFAKESKVSGLNRLLKKSDAYLLTSDP